jgi:hypothetical protein
MNPASHDLSLSQLVDRMTHIAERLETVAKRAKKKEFGADPEADAILAGLPRHFDQESGYPKTEPNAWVYIDASGRLCILPTDGGWLGIDEKNLGYVHGDCTPFTD